MASERERQLTADDITKDPLVEKWLNTIQNQTSRTHYTAAAKTFFLWLGQTPTEFIKAVIVDGNKDILERQNLALSKILEFHNYAMTEMPKRGHYSKQIVGKGLSYNATKAILGGVRSFLGMYGILVKLTGRYNLKPRERNPNERLRLSTDQVRSLVTNARLPRDRAIIIFIAQTGCDLNTLLSMKYKTVKKALESEPPVQLDLFRHKAAQPYFTFMGVESIEAIRAYLQDLKQRGIEPEPDGPLWLTEKKSEPLTEYNVEKALRICAVKAGLINGGDPYNIAGAHALREFFSSALNDAKVPKNYIDEMLGHVPSQMEQAYFKKNAQVLREEYVRAQGALSLAPRGGGADVSKLKAEFGDHITAQILKNRQIEEKNADLENRLTAMIADNQSLKARLTNIESRLPDIAILKELIKEQIMEAGKHD
jgi:integrase